jgi:hypothetical protein
MLCAANGTQGSALLEQGNGNDSFIKQQTEHNTDQGHPLHHSVATFPLMIYYNHFACHTHCPRGIQTMTDFGKLIWAS